MDTLLMNGQERRRLVLPLSAGYPLQELFRRICQRLEDWPVAAPVLAAVQQNSG